jgi:phage/plasmid primase-like uncharacterized protein/RecA-family ATPase
VSADFNLAASRAFRDAMQRHGLEPPEYLVTDGEIHRCDTQAKNGRGDGAYALRIGDATAFGGFQNWQEDEAWVAWSHDDGREPTAAEREVINRERAAAAKASAEAKARRQAEAAATARRLWVRASASASAADGHGYLQKKQVKAHGARARYGKLAVPLLDERGEIVNLQLIWPDGAKRFLRGGRTRGCYFKIDGDPHRVAVAEGFATAASIAEATGRATVVAFDAGNLLAAAELTKKTAAAGADVVVAADDDWKAATNKGLAKASEAARAIGAKLAVPDFGPDRRDGDTDFNDLMLARGAEQVRACVEAGRASWRTQIAVLDVAAWDGAPVPEPDYVVPGCILANTTTLFTGEGAAGKSTLGLQLCAAAALTPRVDWLGAAPAPGPALFFDAEDAAEVMHWRLAAILRHHGGAGGQIAFADAARHGLHLVSYAGKDAVLGALNQRSNRVEPTRLYDYLLEMVSDIKPKMVVIASAANVFAGSEIIRPQVQQFIGLLTKLAMRAGGGVVLIAHPSLTGISTDTGLSGSTQWHNAVRARFYLRGAKPEGGEQPDGELRELVFMKNNYGPISERITLRYQRGLFVPIERATFDAAARAAMAEMVFLTILRRFERQHRYVSARSGPSYAPAEFAEEREAKDAACGKKDLERAMRDLLRAEKVRQEQYGKPSNRHYRLAAAEPQEEIPF